MGRHKVYKDSKEKQKAYRERKKGSGYRQLSVMVPESVYGALKGNPGLLVEAYIELHKTKKGRGK